MLNEKLLDVMGNDVTQEQAFAHASDGTADDHSQGDPLRVTVSAWRNARSKAARFGSLDEGGLLSRR